MGEWLSATLFISSLDVIRGILIQLDGSSTGQCHTSCGQQHAGGGGDAMLRKCYLPLGI